MSLMYELKALEFQLRQLLPTEKQVGLSGVGASEALLLCDRHPAGSFQVATTHINLIFTLSFRGICSVECQSKIFF